MFVILFIFDVQSRQVSNKKCGSTYKTAYATACKQIFPYLYLQPSYWRWTLRLKHVEDIVKIKIVV